MKPARRLPAARAIASNVSLCAALGLLLANHALSAGTAMQRAAGGQRLGEWLLGLSLAVGMQVGLRLDRELVARAWPRPRIVAVSALLAGVLSAGQHVTTALACCALIVAALACLVLCVSAVMRAQGVACRTSVAACAFGFAAGCAIGSVEAYDLKATALLPAVVVAALALRLQSGPAWSRGSYQATTSLGIGWLGLSAAVVLAHGALAAVLIGQFEAARHVLPVYGVAAGAGIGVGACLLPGAHRSIAWQRVAPVLALCVALACLGAYEAHRLWAALAHDITSVAGLVGTLVGLALLAALPLSILSGTLLTHLLRSAAALRPTQRATHLAWLLPLGVILCGSDAWLGRPRAVPDVGTAASLGQLLHGHVNAAYATAADDSAAALSRQSPTPDLIVHVPPPAWRRDAWHLHEPDFYAASQRALAADGLFVQAVSLDETDETRFDTTLHHVASAFAWASIWADLGQSRTVFIVAGNAPKAIDLDRLRRALEAPIAALQPVGVTDAGGLLSLLAQVVQVAPPPPTAPSSLGDYLLHLQPPAAAFTALRQASRVAALRRLLPAEATARSAALATALDGYTARGMLQAADECARTLEQTPASDVQRDGVHLARDLVAQLSGPESMPVVTPADLAATGPFARAAQLYVGQDVAAALDVLENAPSTVSDSAAHTFFYNYLLYRNGLHERAARGFAALAERADSGGFSDALSYYAARNQYALGANDVAVRTMQNLWQRTPSRPQ